MFINRETDYAIRIVRNLDQNNLSQIENIANNNKRVKDIRSQAMNATTEDEKNKIKSQFESIDKEFLADQKLEEGNKLYFNKNYQGCFQ